MSVPNLHSKSPQDPVSSDLHLSSFSFAHLPLPSQRAQIKQTDKVRLPELTLFFWMDNSARQINFQILENKRRDTEQSRQNTFAFVNISLNPNPAPSKTGHYLQHSQNCRRMETQIGSEWRGGQDSPGAGFRHSHTQSQHPLESLRPRCPTNRNKPKHKGST